MRRCTGFCGGMVPGKYGVSGIIFFELCRFEVCRLHFCIGGEVPK